MCKISRPVTGKAAPQEKTERSVDREVPAHLPTGSKNDFKRATSLSEIYNKKHFDTDKRKPCIFTGGEERGTMQMHNVRKETTVAIPSASYGPGSLQRQRQEIYMKKMTIIGCILWIAGLAAFIIGLNLSGSVKEWMTVAGSIVFLAGLGITGAVWMRKKNGE